MAKQRHPEPNPNSSRNSLILLAVGAVLVAGLVVWALTRTVQAPVPASAETFPTTTMPAAQPTATDSGTSTAAATTAESPTVIPGDKSTVKRIAAEDLKDKFDRGDVVIIDTRAASAFAAGHIPGALNIPMASVQANLDQIPKGKEVVTYCT
jgi:hypothetical protein